MANTPLVGIVMGSDSDWPVLRAAGVTLKEFGIHYEAKVLSAHPTPDEALDYAAAFRTSAVLVGLSLVILAATSHLLGGLVLPGARRR